MALIDCPECAHKVSDRAVSCPNCGYPVSRSRREFSLFDPLAEVAAVAEEFAATVHRALRREDEKSQAREEKPEEPESKGE